MRRQALFLAAALCPAVLFAQLQTGLTILGSNPANAPGVGDVTGPGSSAAGEVALFADGTGQLLARDSRILKKADGVLGFDCFELEDPLSPGSPVRVCYEDTTGTIYPDFAVNWGTSANPFGAAEFSGVVNNFGAFRTTTYELRNASLGTPTADARIIAENSGGVNAIIFQMASEPAAGPSGVTAATLTTAAGGTFILRALRADTLVDFAGTGAVGLTQGATMPDNEKLISFETTNATVILGVAGLTTSGFGVASGSIPAVIAGGAIIMRFGGGNAVVNSPNNLIPDGNNTQNFGGPLFFWNLGHISNTFHRYVEHAVSASVPSNEHWGGYSETTGTTVTLPDPSTLTGGKFILENVDAEGDDISVTTVAGNLFCQTLTSIAGVATVGAFNADSTLTLEERGTVLVCMDAGSDYNCYPASVGVAP